MSMVARVRSACVLTSAEIDPDERAFWIADTLLELRLRAHRREIEALRNSTSGVPAFPAQDPAQEV